MQITVATRDDIPAMMDLESRNYVDHLTETERADGFISILHEQRWFEDAVDAGGIHIATTDEGAVIGLIAVTAAPTGPHDHLPAIMQAMLRLTDNLEFDGKPLTQQRLAFRGPVVIERDYRGRGIYSTFNDVTRSAYADRFDVAVLFVAADNNKSIHTTTTKLGARPLAPFNVDGKRYQLLAFAF